jgi:hypothetical protein
MGDERELRHAVALEDETHRCLELLAGIGGMAERRVRVGRRAHLGIAIGTAEAEKVEAPDVESRLAQRIAPGNSIEAVGDRQRGRERRAVHVEHDAIRRRCGRQMSKEQLQPGAWRRNPVVLLARIELGSGLLQHTAFLRSTITGPTQVCKRSSDGTLRRRSKRVGAARNYAPGRVAPSVLNRAFCSSVRLS